MITRRHFLRHGLWVPFVPALIADVAHVRIASGVTHDSFSGSTTGTGGLNSRSDNTDNMKAVKFTASASYTCTSIALNLYKAGSPTFNVKAAIWTDVASAPGALVGTESNAIASSTFTTSEAIYTFTGVSATLVSGTSYWVVVRESDGAAYSGSNYVQVPYAASSGFSIFRSETGASWASANGNVRFAFTL
jgi:hypothetical protein